ncbi:DUF2218 domain-containing protein [Acinetobacter qingfengensis]|uniref:Uncharacterized protein n=1 Tax=Acinetobacter qingfengensis TaxID=1262585 RepID=A0A1E7QYZ2_9GAMM|nr:DUF2218 domain-containing protein [Acinetobacter qingfengensis]KAA8733125.1 DUF2218 domain-containing protein [Acinetobacter qingfengensis]OEY92274.1 hypothetical protein BJI46_05885 [Acinetobacter qingfengensis]
MTDTNISELRIDTLEAARIIKRLSNHWKHKFEITEQHEITTIPFSEQSRVFLSPHQDYLLAKIETTENERLEQLEHVVISHINRMANQEFPAHWIRA